jgi:transaldolase/glucose-6-phosphate isomerase
MTFLSEQTIHPGELQKSYEGQLEKTRAARSVTMLVTRHISVFGRKKPAHRKLIANRLGWIDVAETMPDALGRIEQLAAQVKKDGYRHVLVLGMGGSSLFPEVMGDIFGRKHWLKSYDILDTSSPEQLDRLLRHIDLFHSFIFVSSKSGETLETMSQFRFFFRKIKESRPLKVGRYFAAVTDEGSELHRIARRNRFREVFLNPGDIGGRYSALSYFGLAPGAFTCADLKALLQGGHERLEFMKERGGDCHAATLGTLLAVGARAGRDKVQFITDPTLAPFIPWLEQLLAESTGKDGKGIIPIDGPANGGGYSDDLIYVRFSLKGEARRRTIPNLDPRVPVVTITLPDTAALGAEVLKWEMATAVASIILGVNPFDEPNVAESKKNALAVMRSPRGPRKVVPLTPIAAVDGAAIVSIDAIKGVDRRRHMTAEALFRSFLSNIHPGDYLAILCYVDRDDKIERLLTAMRKMLAEKYGIVSLRGYGPRYLHSTGQLFKGGSQKGHFLVLDRDYATDYDIPTMNISFGRLIKAQEAGDIKAMKKRKRPIMQINLGLDPASGLAALKELISSL